MTTLLTMPAAAGAALRGRCRIVVVLVCAVFAVLGHGFAVLMSAVRAMLVALLVTMSLSRFAVMVHTTWTESLR
jgi:hypothetical protein